MAAAGPRSHPGLPCVDDIQVVDVINVSREALAAGLFATCCQHHMPLASGVDVDVVAQRLDQDPDACNAPNEATVVFLAPHTVPSLCGSSPRAAGSRQSIAMLFGNTWMSCAAM